MPLSIPQNLLVYQALRLQWTDNLKKGPIHLSPLKQILRVFIVTGLLTLPIDQWTKDFAREQYLIHEDTADTTIYQGRRDELLAKKFGDNWLTVNLTYVRNHGASWGVMKDLSEDFRRPVLILMGLVLTAAFLWAAVRFQLAGLKNSATALTLLSAGAVGNFLDRIRLGYVVDLVTIRSGLAGHTWSLPAFNVADIIIVLGLFYLLTTIVLSSNQKN